VVIAVHAGYISSITLARLYSLSKPLWRQDWGLVLQSMVVTQIQVREGVKNILIIPGKFSRRGSWEGLPHSTKIIYFSTKNKTPSNCSK
jgi:hypothetical protein